MPKLFSANLKMISGLSVRFPNVIVVFFYFEPMVFSNKYVASEFSGRISRHQLAVEYQQVLLAPQKHFLFLSGARHVAPATPCEGELEHTVNLAECPGVQRNKYVLTFR